MAKRDEALFEESSQGAVSFATAIGFILGVALMLGGLLLMSYAFTPDPEGMTGLWLFSGGLAATFLGFAIPFGIMGHSSK